MVSPEFHCELDACFQHQGSVWVGGHAGLPLHDQGTALTHTHTQAGRVITTKEELTHARTCFFLTWRGCF